MHMQSYMPKTQLPVSSQQMFKQTHSFISVLWSQVLTSLGRLMSIYQNCTIHHQVILW